MVLGSIFQVQFQLVRVMQPSTQMNLRQVYQSGNYIQVITNSFGCDSTISLNLNLNFTGLNEFSNVVFSIYPNPSNDVLTITSQFESNAYFELIDNQGRIVYQDELRGTQTVINLESIDTGNYYLKIDEGSTLLKFVKL